MSVFISDDVLVGIDVYAWEEGGRTNFSLSAPGDKKILPVKETFKFKRPAWGETKAIMSEAVTIFGDKAEINPYKLIDARIKVLLREWTLSDEDGNPMPVTRESIDKLSPQLISVLGEALGSSAEFSIS